MIKGIVNNNRAFVPLVVGSNSSVQEIVTLVDTGFTGDLKISPEKAKELGLETTHMLPVTLANGKILSMPVSLAIVSMEGVKNAANVLIGDGDPLIGFGLLKRFSYVLNIDFKYNLITLQKAT